MTRLINRRGILSGLLVAGSMHPAEAPAVTFIKGHIITRFSHYAPQFPLAASSPTVAVMEYAVFDGEKFISLDSVAGQDIVRALSE